MAKLGEIATYINGYAFKPTDWSNSGLPIIRIQDLTGNSYQANRYEGEYDLKYEVLYGDVLISWSASLGIYVWKGEKALLNQHIFKVIFDKVDIDKSFFVHQLGSILENAKLEAHGATMKHLTKPVFDSLPFYLPEKIEQVRIANELNKVCELIEFRNCQLTQLENLVKSRFIEMFGDPVTNTNGWNQVALSEVTSKIGSGATPRGGKKSYQSEGIVLIRSMNVHDGLFEYKELAYLTESQAAKLDNVTVEENDIFINITGASVARSCIVPSEILPARVNQHVAIIRCIADYLHPVFANNMFRNDSFKGQLLAIGESGGATRQAITKQQLESLIIILPPLGLQDQFAAFVEQTDKLKFVGSQTKALLNTLYLHNKMILQDRGDYHDKL